MALTSSSGGVVNGRGPISDREHFEGQRVDPKRTAAGSTGRDREHPGRPGRAGSWFSGSATTLEPATPSGPPARRATRLAGSPRPTRRRRMRLSRTGLGPAQELAGGKARSPRSQSHLHILRIMARITFSARMDARDRQVVASRSFWRAGNRDRAYPGGVERCGNVMRGGAAGPSPRPGWVRAAGPEPGGTAKCGRGGVAGGAACSGTAPPGDRARWAGGSVPGAGRAPRGLPARSSAGRPLCDA